MRILVVDDEYFAVQGILNGVNWDVLPYEEILQAGSYGQAVELLTPKPVDVVLCDIEMPDESGLELIAWVNEHWPETECIILSCHDEFDYARQAVALNCLEYALKPVRYDRLTQMLRHAAEVVEEKRHQRTLSDYGQKSIDRISAEKKKEAPSNEGVAEKAAAYIEQHIAEELSVRSLADMAYVSSDHLTRLFKKRFGCSVSEYVYQRRMILAGELLKDENMTVTMVSGMVGYGNYSYFTDQFRRYYKMTPREYASKAKQGVSHTPRGNDGPGMPGEAEKRR